MNVTWLASFSASCMHTVLSMIAKEPLTDPKLSQAMQPSVDLFSAEIVANDWPQPQLLQNLDALSCAIDSNLELAETALIKTIGRDQNVNQVQALTRCITAIENAFRAALPAVLDELQLRIGPIRMLWEACGPGMLKMVGHLTDENLIATDAQVVLVHPVLGGAGTAHLEINCVTMEAVLTNTHENLPEVLRLSWLLSLLNLDLPIYSENLSSSKREQVSAISMIPPILTAAAEIDFLKYDPNNIERALTAWHLDNTLPKNTPQVLHKWWETYQTRRPRWPVALRALQQMLFDGE